MPSSPTPDIGQHHIRNALERTCDALVTMQIVGFRLSDPEPQHAETRRYVSLAVESLRQAVEALRCADGKEERLDSGFVMGADPSSPS